MSVYPSNIPTTGDLPDAGANLSSNPHSSLHDDVRDEVIAIAGELGVEPSGTETTVRARLDAGLGLREIVYFTSNGTFTKASYPWLRAVRVRVQGAGGGGGGAAATGANQASNANGGAGGAYAESLIAASSLGSSVTVTVGGGGAGGNGFDGGAAGTESSFGVTADAFRTQASAGTGGASRNADSSLQSIFNAPTAVTTAGTGDLVVPSEAVVGHFHRFANTAVEGNSMSGGGGGSVLGAGGNARVTSGNGNAGIGFGSGGGGAFNAQNNASNRSGGAGAPGVVIVELYA
jgi:hypothetical protein